MTISAGFAYRDYLQSSKWRAIRKLALERAGNVCVNCGSDERLEAHHLTYERMGFERVEDLLVLCRPCHAQQHGRPSANGPVAWMTREEITRRVHEEEFARCLDAWRKLRLKVRTVERALDRLFEEAMADSIVTSDIYDGFAEARMHLAFLTFKLDEAAEGKPSHDRTSARRVFGPDE